MESQYAYREAMKAGRFETAEKIADENVRHNRKETTHWQELSNQAFLAQRGWK